MVDDKIIDEYCRNELHKLKKICDPIIYRKGVPTMYHDDLYSLAMDTLMDSVKRYDDSKVCKFETFLIGNIKRTFYDWTREVENYLSEDIGFSSDEMENYSPQMQEYLYSLSKVQREILRFLVQGYHPEEIIEILHIDFTLYKDSIVAIKSHKNTRKIKKLCRGN